MWPQVRADERRWRRGDLLTVAGALLLGAVVAWIVLTVQHLSADLQDANAARDALARQVQALGEHPVAGPPGSRGDPGQTVRGPRGAQGPPGTSGPPGATGPTGPSGKPGATGKTGAAGADGTSGFPGPAGNDGAAGPAGPPGPQGDPGPAGKDGHDGMDGHDGQTCPTGYRLQAPPDDPDALVCRRDGAPASPDPTPSTSPPAVLTPDRRRT
ncbi:collagen-like protein [Streptomyces sp. NPDC059101]|uniref:collagen-like protein n=1 Tax=Streptomyces sp. NPDC059101 TaxID=3346728 RepID=UPI0036B0DE97